MLGAAIAGAIGNGAGEVSGIEGIASIDMEEGEGRSIGCSSGGWIGDSVGGSIKAEESNVSRL